MNKPNLELAFLTSSKGQALLQQLQSEDLSENRILPLLTKLRKTYSSEQASSALTMASLRQKAVTKFGEDAKKMFFTDDALQQASDPLIRSYRATQWHNQHIVDVCCGIGSDSIAFAQAGHHVVGVDIDPTRIEIAKYNADALGVSAEFLQADVTESLPDGYDAIFYDPARRTKQGKRIFHVEQYQPPLSLMQTWNALRIIAKISPGVDLVQLRNYQAGVEFISVQGDLKEAVLHQGADFSDYRATLLMSDSILHWDSDESNTCEIGEPLAWLVEPDPSILRAGLVQSVASSLQGKLLDETIAYFTTEHEPDSAWVRSWQILDWMPFQLKRVRAWLRERNIGKITVKKRGSPITPEELIQKLKLKGEQSCTVILTRYQGNPIVLFCMNS